MHRPVCREQERSSIPVFFCPPALRMKNARAAKNPSLPPCGKEGFVLPETRDFLYFT
jgi:hypothetical protein